MRIQPLSFLLGVGVAIVAPAFSRILRPLAVEAAAAGMGMFEEGRRLFAQQIELVEDLTAEARTRREQLLSSGNGDRRAPIPKAAAPAARRRRRHGAPTDPSVA